MPESFSTFFSAEPVLAAANLEIQLLQGGYSFRDELPLLEPGAARPFVNSLLNSRVTQNLAKGDWSVRGSAQLEAGSRPLHLLHHGDRILVHGDGRWVLFTDELSRVSSGKIVTSDPVIDPSNGYFYLADEIGMIRAFRLANGQLQFGISLTLGQSYYRRFIARLDDKLIVVSVERQLGRESGTKPKHSTIEIFRFDEPQSIDDDGVLRSGRVVADLLRKSLNMNAAMVDGTLVTATDDQINFINGELKIRAALNDRFKPIALSLNNAGVIYIVLADDGLLKLRAITEKGERLFSAALPEDFEYQIYPPIIGYDHQIYLIGSNRLMALARGGRCVWEYQSKYPIAGAIVTPANDLIISSGDELGVFDAAGNYRQLYRLENEIIKTPPALSEKGELLFATDQKLYCLHAAGTS